jgi:hypothetical protein
MEQYSKEIENMNQEEIEALNKQEKALAETNVKNSEAVKFKGQTKNGLKKQLKSQRIVNQEFGELQNYLIEEYPEEILQENDEGAGRVAIRLLKELKRRRTERKEVLNGKK